jgi:hypothetical protein
MNRISRSMSDFAMRHNLAAMRRICGAPFAKAARRGIVPQSRFGQCTSDVAALFAHHAHGARAAAIQLSGKIIEAAQSARSPAPMKAQPRPGPITGRSRTFHSEAPTDRRRPGSVLSDGRRAEKIQLPLVFATSISLRKRPPYAICRRHYA